MPVAFQPQGLHLLADLKGIKSEALRHGSDLEKLLLQSAEAAGARILFSHFHAFGVGEGVTGVVLLAESHISIHTWPESGFLAADIFMCGKADAHKALAVLRAALKPASCSVREILRGVE